MRLFEAKDLTKKYDKTVLNHLDFSIDEGEVVGIIGVSGCGKSTLARLVSGIEKPSSGSLLYQGKTVDFKKSRKDIQLILQNPIEGNAVDGLKLSHQLSDKEGGCQGCFLDNGHKLIAESGKDIFYCLGQYDMDHGLTAV